MNTIIKNLLIFGVGGAVGALITYRVVTSKRDLQELDLKESYEYLNFKYEHLLDEHKILLELTPAPTLLNLEDKVIEKHIYSPTPEDLEQAKRLAKDYIPEEDEMEDGEDEEDEEAYVEDLEDDEEEEELIDRIMHPNPVQINPPEPYLITEEEFSEDKLHFSKVQLTYYEDDATLVDEDDTIVDDIDYVIGNGIEFLNGAGVIYIRNEVLSIDFEVTLVTGSYSEALVGYINNETNIKKVN